MDWKALEAAWIAESQSAIEKWMRKNPKHQAYAFAFHECYRELDAQIAFPWLAVNSIENLRRGQGTKDVHLEWNPADWRWTNILPAPKRSELGKWEAELKGEANRSTQAHWYKTEKRFLDMMVRVARALWRSLKGHDQTTDDFVVCFNDEEGGLEFIRRCVPARLFQKHFAQFGADETGAEAATKEERINRYFDDPYTYEKQILALGEEAVEPLIKMLKGNKDGWCAASLLGDLGIRTKQVIQALRDETHGTSGTAEHSARALCLLGDVEFLFPLVGDAKSRSVAVVGILTGLKVRASNCPHPIPLDYRPAERLLEMNAAAVTEMVTEEIKPGSSLIEIKPSDVDEALRGLSSEHVVIRQHAVCVLGDRALGAAAGKVVLPRLAERLHDEVPNIRRLTLLALQSWKTAAKPFHEAMRKLQADKDRDIRFWAHYVFDQQ